jgi:hypothetical protein
MFLIHRAGLPRISSKADRSIAPILQGFLPERDLLAAGAR